MACLALLAWAAALRLWPLVAFWLVFGVLMFQLRRRPDSRFAKGLLLALGPRPRPGEWRSRYLLRVAGTAMGVFAVIAGAAFAGAFAFLRQIEGGNPWPMAVFTFGLPVLAGMAGLGAFASLLEAAWLRLTGRDRVSVDRDEAAV